MTYVDGMVVPVPAGSDRETYAEFARKTGPIFKDAGAIRVVDCWGDDVPDGKVTDFRRAVQAGAGETVVFSWIEWPDKATRDAGMAKVALDPRMQSSGEAMPLDGKRMIIGGFEVVAEL